MQDILAFAFSPRQGGNSDILLDEFARGARTAGARVEVERVCEMNIKACLECGGCDASGECVQHDDMDLLYPRLLAATKVAIATPIFFYGPPAQGKAMIDRVQALWAATRLDKTLLRQGRGFFIGVGATKGQDLFQGSELVFKYFLDAIGLPKSFDSLTFRRVEGKGAILEREGALEQAFQAGHSFALSQ